MNEKIKHLGNVAKITLQVYAVAQLVLGTGMLINYFSSGNVKEAKKHSKMINDPVSLGVLPGWKLASEAYILYKTPDEKNEPNKEGSSKKLYQPKL